MKRGTDGDTQNWMVCQSELRREMERLEDFQVRIRGERSNREARLSRRADLPCV
jgi:hypothetical protein